MQKRFVAILLAVVMLLACATTAFAAEKTYKISSAKDMALIAQHPDADFEITCDIDFQSAVWTPVGTAQKPFTGTINGNGYEITNMKFADKPVSGFIAYNAGTVKDVVLYNTSATLTGVKLFGTIAADNSGTISGCETDVTFITIGAAKDAQIGQIAGVNSGVIEDSEICADLTVTANKSAMIGGLAAVNSGKITSSSADGRMIATGTATMGLLVNKAEAGSSVTDSRFTGSMALINGELVKKMTVESAKNASMKDCLWRDNSNSLELITGEEREMRETILNYSHAMSMTPWTASRDLDMVELNTDSAASRGHDKHYKAGETWYGMEYSHKFKGLAAFLYCFNPDGTFKDFVVDGADGFDMYFTNDCSAATINSIQTISPTLQSTGASNSIPYYPVGSCGLSNSLPVGYKTKESQNATQNTTKYYTQNGRDGMAEAWALAEPGDGCTSVTDGHSRLYTGSIILRDEKGVIDPDQSYIIQNGMGDGITRKIYHVDYETDGLYTITELMDHFWIPYTTQELIDGHKPEAEIKFSGVDKFDRAHLCCGVIDTNYGMLNVKLQILNQDGSTAFEKLLWQRVYKWDAGGGDDWARRTIRHFDMSDFATSLVGCNLKEGKTYTVKVTTMLTDLDEYEVTNYKFVY